MAEFMIVAVNEAEPLDQPIWEGLVEAASIEEAVAIGSMTFHKELPDIELKVAIHARAL